MPLAVLGFAIGAMVILGGIGGVSIWWLCAGGLSIGAAYAGATFFRGALEGLALTRRLAGSVGWVAQAVAVLAPFMLVAGPGPSTSTSERDMNGIVAWMTHLVQWPWPYHVPAMHVNDLFGSEGLFKAWSGLVAMFVRAGLDVGVWFALIAGMLFLLHCCERLLQRVVASSLGVQYTGNPVDDESRPRERTCLRPYIPGDRVTAVREFRDMKARETGVVRRYNDQGSLVVTVEGGNPFAKVDVAGVRLASLEGDPLAGLRSAKFPFIEGDRVWVPRPRPPYGLWPRGMGTIEYVEERSGAIRPWVRFDMRPYERSPLENFKEGRLVEGVDGHAGPDPRKLPPAVSLGR